MKNVIVQRIADFLLVFPPFQYVEKEVLFQLSKEVEVVYLPKDKFLFQTADKVHDFFYVVEQGAIELSINLDGIQQKIDLCDAGDILGLRPFFAENEYMMSAQAKEDSIVYAIPIQVFKPLLNENQQVLQFLLESFASNTRNPTNKEDAGRLISSNLNQKNSNDGISFFQSLPFTKNPICISIETHIQTAAKLMTKHSIGSLLVSDNDLPKGILTDKDLRSKVATGEVPIDASITTIMSSPVKCVSPELTLAEAQLLLLKEHIGHLCVTQDGSDASKIIGILTEHDLVTAQTNNPVSLLKKIERSSSIASLRDVRIQLSTLIDSFLQANLPIKHLLSVVEEIQQNLVQKLIVLTQSELNFYPQQKFCWLSLGSQGRGEQILLTDQDNALIFEDVSEEELDTTRIKFIEFAQRVNQHLNEIGYEYCPAEMMASNPKWCLSLREWKKQFVNWIDQPTDEKMMLCAIFFDFKASAGDHSLADDLSEYLSKKLEGKQQFFAYLGVDALKNPPPLSFFKQFLVETDGKHKDEFDIKARALMPLIDAARILSLSIPISGINSTVKRFEKLIEIEPQNKLVYEDAIRSFYVLSEMRTREGIQHNSSGRFISLPSLSKRDKIRLKRSFQPISDLQVFLTNRFKLTYFR